MNHRLAAPLVATLLLALPAAGQSLDGHPFHVLAPSTLPWGGHVIETGLEYRTSAVPAPLAKGDAGDLLRVPEVRYRLGFGRAELSIGGTAWQTFSPDEKAISDQDEVGDLSFWLSVSALQQRSGRPGLGFAIGAKLPNASAGSGLGTDEADTFFAVLVGHESLSHAWQFNLGLAILGDPNVTAAQEDMLTYGVAGRHGRRHCLAWELYGRALASDGPRDLNESTLEAGYMYRGRHVTADVSLLYGLVENSGDIGASAGIAWRIGEAVR